MYGLFRSGSCRCWYGRGRVGGVFTGCCLGWLRDNWLSDMCEWPLQARRVEGVDMWSVRTDWFWYWGWVVDIGELWMCLGFLIVATGVECRSISILIRVNSRCNWVAIGNEVWGKWPSYGRDGRVDKWEWGSKWGVLGWGISWFPYYSLKFYIFLLSLLMLITIFFSGVLGSKSKSKGITMESRT